MDWAPTKIQLGLPNDLNLILYTVHVPIVQLIFGALVQYPVCASNVAGREIFMLKNVGL